MAAQKKKQRHEQLFLRQFSFIFAARGSPAGKFRRFFRKNVATRGAVRQKTPCGKTVHAV
jgi:hypothetical protein